MALLATKAFHFGHRHAGDTYFGQCFTHVIQFEGLDNRVNFFHFYSLITNFYGQSRR
ncbi:hypothetical protein D3C72_2450670 [compost metagenome]